jgi:hypothetical protein
MRATSIFTTIAALAVCIRGRGAEDVARAAAYEIGSGRAIGREGYRVAPGVSARLMKSRTDTIRAPPNCPRRRRSLSSLTMKSDFAVAAHSRMRLSSGSSLITCSLSFGETITERQQLFSGLLEHVPVCTRPTGTYRPARGWSRPLSRPKCRYERFQPARGR